MEQQGFPKVDKIDPINYRRVTVDTAGGPMPFEGMTVRALRNILAEADQDAVVCYAAEVTAEVKASIDQGCEILMGVVAGAAVQSQKEPVIMLFGPETVRAIKAQEQAGG
jgi:hypothetical protein